MKTVSKWLLCCAAIGVAVFAIGTIPAVSLGASATADHYSEQKDADKNPGIYNASVEAADCLTTNGDVQVTGAVACPSDSSKAGQVIWANPNTDGATAIFTGRTVNTGCFYDVTGKYKGGSPSGNGSGPNVWYSAFSDSKDAHIVLYINDRYATYDDYIPKGGDGTLSVMIAGGSSETYYAVGLSAAPSDKVGFDKTSVTVQGGGGSAPVNLHGQALGSATITGTCTGTTPSGSTATSGSTTVTVTPKLARVEVTGDASANHGQQKNYTVKAYDDNNTDITSQCTFHWGASCPQFENGELTTGYLDLGDGASQTVDWRIFSDGKPITQDYRNCNHYDSSVYVNVYLKSQWAIGDEHVDVYTGTVTSKNGVASSTGTGNPTYGTSAFGVQGWCAPTQVPGPVLIELTYSKATTWGISVTLSYSASVSGGFSIGVGSVNAGITVGVSGTGSYSSTTTEEVKVNKTVIPDPTRWVRAWIDLQPVSRLTNYDLLECYGYSTGLSLIYKVGTAQIDAQTVDAVVQAEYCNQGPS